jgi:GWxTD domain-containing protein
VKNSWISYVALSLSLVLLFAASVPEATAKKKRKGPGPEDITNFLLSPSLSQWLVGAISRMATQEEIAAYLALISDEEAHAFIDEFWAKRGPDAVWPNKGKRQLFEERSAEADRLFDEGTYRGRHTDRGTTYVLYGPPDDTRYEQSAQVRSSTVEVWTYSGTTEAGLDDKRPKNFYLFMKQGDLTVEYRGAIQRRDRFRKPPGGFH